MKNTMKLASIALVLLFTLFGLTNKASAAKLTLYCSVEIDVCEMLEQAYEKATGTKVAMTRASSGETFAKIKAESSNPIGFDDSALIFAKVSPLLALVIATFVPVAFS